MHNHLQRTLERAVRVQRDRIEPQIHEVVAPVTLSSWAITDRGGDPVTPAHALGHEVDEGRNVPEYTPFAIGAQWGEPWTTRWFKIEGQIPEGVEGDLELILDLGWFDHSVGGHCEALVFAADGVPVKGLHPKQRWVRLRGKGARPGLLSEDGSFVAYIEAAANPLLLGLPPFIVTHHGEMGNDAEFEQFRVRSAGLARFHSEVYELSLDLDVAAGLASQISTTEPRHWRLLRSIEDALDVYDERDAVLSASKARLALAEVLAQPANATAHRVTAVGHAHMDSAWLWPVRETVRKLARTVSNALALLDTDESLTYTMTSAQHFEWIEQNYPDLFSRMSEYIEQGRLIPVGGMWVEVDGVMPTGESFVRQILLGKQYFADRFDVESHEIWLPDSFGYSGALPQLAQRSGSDVFLTQKISWNDTTTFPHHSFWWEGIDGTRVFTHFPPSDTYAASVTASELVHSVANFRDKAIASHSLLAYGYGDGGGGPTREMASRIARFRDLEGAPRVISGTPDQFFSEAATELRQVPTTSVPAPVWSGELYLELHRGSLTSQQAMKRGNRRSEALLRTAERASATATVLAGVPYPAQRLEAVWKEVLLNQFHDILPGTSIAWVHREARDAYVRLEEDLLEIIGEALTALQAAEVIGGNKTGSTHSPEQQPVLHVVEPGGHVLDNGLLRVHVDHNGHVSSLITLSNGFESVTAGRSLNEFQLFRDEPIRWDAWDLDRHVLRHPRAIHTISSMEVLEEDGAAGVRVIRHVGDSTITTITWLRAGSERVDFECDVDWQEREQMLKVAFPLAVRARTARYETQYGFVERPLHANTAADEAMFEGSVHRWLQIGDGSAGIAVLNRTIAGADARVDESADGTNVRFTLLRGAMFPDPDADRGLHHFDWAVVPGADVPAAVRSAIDFTRPEEEPDSIPPLVELVVEHGHAVLDWTKLAEDGSGDIIIRLYETQGAQASARLRSPVLFSCFVSEMDLLERPAPLNGPSRALKTSDETTSVELEKAELFLGPFQVATLRIRGFTKSSTDENA